MSRSEDCKLSGIVLVQNNARTIKAVITQLSALCDEVIAVDGGSSDNTLSIVESFPKVRAFTRKFDGNFAAQRNFALDQARGTWTFSLDSDELIGARAFKWIPRLIRIPGINWYNIPRYWLVEIDQQIKYLSSNPYYRSRQYRLLRNLPRIRYLESGTGVHERLDKNRLGKGMAIRNFHIFHYDFLLKTRNERKNKVRRYNTLDPDQAHVHDMYLWEDRLDIETADLSEELPGDLRQVHSVETYLKSRGLA